MKLVKASIGMQAICHEINIKFQFFCKSGNGQFCVIEKCPHLPVF